MIFYAAVLCVLCLLQVRFVVAQQYGDWSAFWAAGATAGTHDLLDPRAHARWQHTHNVPSTIFPYLPGAAWLLAPLKHASLALGYAINFALMTIAGIASAVIAARAYRMPRELTLALTFGWAPAIASLATGQNSMLLLLLVMCGAWGMSAQSWLLTGLAAGALLYKPLYALPFLAMLIVQRNWRALGIAAVCAVIWYVVSALATAGDWMWPQHYAAAIRGYAIADAQGNAVKAISLPQLALRLHVSPLIAYVGGAALFFAVVALTVRMPKLQAVGLTMLAALALGPHTLPYDLTLMLPAVFCFMHTAADPLRTRTIVAMFLIAPFWLLSGVIRFDVLAVLCTGFLGLLLVINRAAEKSKASPFALSTAL